MPVWPCLFLAERLWVPPGPADGWRDVGSVLHHGFAMVRSSHGTVHLSRQQPKAGVRELSPRRAASLPGHPRTEVDRLGHLPAHGLLCIHDWGPAGWSDTLCNAAPRWLEYLGRALICDSTNNNIIFSPQFIPMPVLYGVFLYMGASSLKGIQVICTLTQI